MATDLVSGFLKLASSNLFSKIAWAISQFILVQNLGPNNFGTLATIWSISFLTASFSDLGTNQVLLREGARHPGIAQVIARQVQELQIVLTIISTILLALLIFFLLPIADVSNNKKIIIIIAATAAPLIDRFQYLYTVFCQLGGKIQIYAQNRALYFIVILALFTVMSLSHTGNDLVGYSCVYLLFTLLSVLILAKRSWVLLYFSNPTLETFSLPELIKEGQPYLRLAFLAIAYGRIEVVTLGLTGHSALAGAYHLSYQIILLVYSISGIFFTITYPRLYKHFGDINKINEDFKDSVRWLSLLTWISFPLIIFYAEAILNILGGEEMIIYRNVLQTLSFLLLLLPGAAALNFLLPMDMQKERVFCDAAGIVFTSLGMVLAISLKCPNFIPVAAIFGYMVSTLTAIIIIQIKVDVHVWSAMTELITIGLRALPPFIILIYMSFPLWIGIILYTGLLILLLYFTDHSVINRISSIIDKKSL